MSHILSPEVIHNPAASQLYPNCFINGEDPANTRTGLTLGWLELIGFIKHALQLAKTFGLCLALSCTDVKQNLLFFYILDRCTASYTTDVTTAMHTVTTNVPITQFTNCSLLEDGFQEITYLYCMLHDGDCHKGRQIREITFTIHDPLVTCPSYYL